VNNQSVSFAAKLTGINGGGDLYRIVEKVGGILPNEGLL
jgi:hypothetical protein